MRPEPSVHGYCDAAQPNRKRLLFGWTKLEEKQLRITTHLSVRQKNKTRVTPSSVPKKGPVCRRVALFGEDTPFVYASESYTRGQDRPPEAKPASPPAPPLPSRSEGHEASESGLASAKSWPLTGSELSRFSAQCRCFTLNHRGRRLSEKKSMCGFIGLPAPFLELYDGVGAIARTGFRQFSVSLGPGCSGAGMLLQRCFSVELC